MTCGTSCPIGPLRRGTGQAWNDTPHFCSAFHGGCSPGKRSCSPKSTESAVPRSEAQERDHSPTQLCCANLPRHGGEGSLSDLGPGPRSCCSGSAEDSTDAAHRIFLFNSPHLALGQLPGLAPTPGLRESQAGPRLREPLGWQLSEAGDAGMPRSSPRAWEPTPAPAGQKGGVRHWGLGLIPIISG